MPSILMTSFMNMLLIRRLLTLTEMNNKPYIARPGVRRSSSRVKDLQSLFMRAGGETLGEPH